MSEQNVTNFYMGSFIISLVGGIMVLVGEFGGWYYYEGGSVTYREWGYVYAYNGPWAILLVPIGAALLYVAYHSYKATQEDPDIEKLNHLYNVSRNTLVTLLVGAILFIILVSENDDWWLSEGFYGGTIGSLISVLLLRNAKNVY